MATERIVRSSNGKEKMEPQPAPVSPAAVACRGRACPASGATTGGGGRGAVRGAARRGARHPPWRRAAPVKGSRTEPHVCACAAHARLLFSSGRACTHAGGWCGCDAHCHCSRLTSLLPLHGTQQPALRGPDGAGAVSTPYALIRWAEQEQEISCACAGGIDFVVIVLFFGNNHAYFVSYIQY